MKITVDTNFFIKHQKLLCSLRSRFQNGGYIVKWVSVTEREIKNGSEIAEFLKTLDELKILEIFVVNESLLGSAKLVSKKNEEKFERILEIISSGSFPQKGARNDLTPGEQRQLRDAMILASHIVEGGELFVSDDFKAFGGGKREKLKSEFELKIIGSWWFLLKLGIGISIRALVIKIMVAINRIFKSK